MNDWKQTLSAARKEYDVLIQKRDDIDSRQAELDIERERLEKRILQLQKTIESLSELVGETGTVKRFAQIRLGGAYDSLKLTEAVRRVLQSADRYWTPINVREVLQAQQYDMTGYANVLASIHAVLKRIYESGDATRIADENGKAMYRWKQNVTVSPEPVNVKIETFPPKVVVTKKE